jgi:chaperonin GroEL
MKIAQTDTLQTISKALNKYIKLISPTYGPAGKKVLIAHSEFNIKAVDDGFEASREFEIENEFENAVIQYIKETTKKTNERAGDGTTTSGILMGAIFNETIGDMGNPMVTLKKNYHKEVKDIEQGIREAVQFIKDKSKKIKTKQELYKIAYNSYNNEEIATLISDTLFKIGEDGLLAIGDSQTAHTEIEMVEGLELEKGYVSPYFINADKEESVLNDAVVITINKRIETFTEILPCLLAVKDSNNRVCIVAEGFGEDALNNTIIAKMKGAIVPLLIETPGFGENKIENLKNIAAITGSKVIDPQITKLDQVTLDMFGGAKRITSKKDRTLIIGGSGTKEEINKRVDELTEKMERMTAPYEKEQLKKHIASLKGGMALIKVGANTENEQKAIKAKVEDSVNATKLAFKDGIVRGGGKTYAEIKTSSVILNSALKAPLNQLKENGEEYLDENVTDPAGVLIAALETGGSIACGLLEMGAIITTKREEDKSKF